MMTSRPEVFRITVQKRSRTLRLYRAARLERTHTIALGRNPLIDKAVEGDEATPLGEFYICAKNPRSKYFLSMCISYPNAEDAERGLADGLITPLQYAEILTANRLLKMPPQHTKLGGEIYLHGCGTSQPGGDLKDWTRGCIALDNAAMHEIYDLVPIVTSIVITE
jgi:murein L,D-transpeptidase YafK